MEQIERIEYMEKILDEGTEAIRELWEALKRYQEVEPKIKELADYYESEFWRKDFSDDEQGKLPKDLKRGILSEDGIYDLLVDQLQLVKELKSLKKI